MPNDAILFKIAPKWFSRGEMGGTKWFWSSAPAVRQNPPFTLYSAGQRKDHAMLVLRFRMRVARHAKTKRPDRGALMTADGAAAAAATYVEAREKARGMFVRNANCN